MPEQEPKPKKRNGMQTFMEHQSHLLERDFSNLNNSSELPKHEVHTGSSQELNLQQTQGNNFPSQMGERDSGSFFGYSSYEEYERAQRAKEVIMSTRGDTGGLETITDRVIPPHRAPFEPKE